MAEEYDESEIVFSNAFSSVLQREEENENHLFGFDGEEEKKKTRRIKKSTIQRALSSSFPVNIPENMFRRYVGKDEDDCSEEEYSDGGKGEIVPPHIIVGRRIQGGQMAFSVCTLKGRDLSWVRNSVLRLTGFLEN